MNAVFGSSPSTSRRVPHISLVFREMWDSTTLAPDLPLQSGFFLGKPKWNGSAWRSSSFPF
jgi:hypothetical protein